MSVNIVEKDETGRVHVVHFSGDNVQRIVKPDISLKRPSLQVLNTLSSVFLPSGYPESVSPDYLHYQIYNSLQAFCSSLAGLIASRATLEGFGVGNASASATHALLLTVLQDVFGRLTTIVGAHYLGTSLFPEAKMYRLLADILNDLAITLDSFLPLLSSVEIPFLTQSSGSSPGLTMVVLCMSAALRALCGVVAGGSKSALSLHFATPVLGKGDLGELSAKDGSKETVLSLIGMLLGSIVVPRLTTRASTYVVLFVLLAGHLAANFVAVRGVALRTLNKQRACLAWSFFTGESLSSTDSRSREPSNVLAPSDLARHERIFQYQSTLRNGLTNQTLGYCTIGARLSDVLSVHSDYRDLLDIFSGQKYVLCIDAQGDAGRSGRKIPRINICLKEGHTPLDQLKAWIHAMETVKLWTANSAVRKRSSTDCIRDALLIVEVHFLPFVERMRQVGWKLDEGALLAGSPKSILMAVDGDANSPETKKDI